MCDTYELMRFHFQEEKKKSDFVEYFLFTLEVRTGK